MTEPLLRVQELSCSVNSDQSILSGISFELNYGEILVLSGKSGAGKTTLLKCLAHLNLYQGQILYRGQAPSSYGIPTYRTRVLYVPQRPSILPSTPRVFLETVRKFRSRNAQDNDEHNVNNPISLAESWGIDPDTWNRDWTSLSGGESQRISLAVAVEIQGAEVLLLDEPTSALDAETTQLVEKHLTGLLSSHSSVKAMIWITHSEEQGKRVGTRWLSLKTGNGRIDGSDQLV